MLFDNELTALPKYTFEEALQKKYFVVAKDLWLAGKTRKLDGEESFVLQFHPAGFRSTLYLFLDCYKTSMICFLNEMHDMNTYALLLMHVFPRFLMTGMAPDFIHPPTVFERPDWSWEEFLQDEAQRLDGTMGEDFVEIPEDDNLNFCYSAIICSFSHISLQGARILAKLFCSSAISVHHSEDSQLAHIIRVSLVGPVNLSYNANRTTFKVKQPTKVIRRNISEAEIRVLKTTKTFALKNSVVNWEFYCRPLLEIIERHSGAPMHVIEEYANTAIQNPTILFTIQCVSGFYARYFARIFCTNDCIAAVYTFSSENFHSNLHFVRISSSFSSSLQTSSEFQGYITFCPATTATAKFRTITNQELQYLRDLRWRARLPALLVAARIRDGKQFHVFKHIALFF